MTYKNIWKQNIELLYNKNIWEEKNKWKKDIKLYIEIYMTYII